MTDAQDRTSSPTLKALTFLGDAGHYVDRILDILEHIALFEDFDEEEVLRLAPYLRMYRALQGVPVIREGDAGDFMLLVVSGRVEIVKGGPDGLPMILGAVGPGGVLGEMSLVDGEPRSASCYALVDSVIAVLDRAGLSTIVTDDPRLGVKLMIELVQILTRRLRELASRLAGTADV